MLTSWYHHLSVVVIFFLLRTIYFVLENIFFIIAYCYYTVRFENLTAMPCHWVTDYIFCTSSLQRNTCSEIKNWSPSWHNSHYPESGTSIIQMKVSGIRYSTVWHVGTYPLEVCIVHYGISVSSLQQNDLTLKRFFRSASYQIVTSDYFPRDKAGKVWNQPLVYNIMDVWKYIFTPPYIFMMVIVMELHCNCTLLLYIKAASITSL